MIILVHINDIFTIILHNFKYSIKVYWEVKGGKEKGRLRDMLKIKQELSPEQREVKINSYKNLYRY